MSERHKAVIRMGEEVNHLKAELSYLRTSLKNSESEKENLKRRLSYFEQREEDDLIKQSLEYDRSKDSYMRNNKYSVYAPRNFSRKF